MLRHFYESSKVLAGMAEIREPDIVTSACQILQNIPSRERVNMELVFGLAHHSLLSDIRRFFANDTRMSFRSRLVPNSFVLNEFEEMMRSGNEPDKEALIRRVFFDCLSRRDPFEKSSEVDYEEHSRKLLGMAETMEVDKIIAYLNEK